MRKEYGLKFIDTVFEVMETMDSLPAEKRAELAGFVSEFWHQHAGVIQSYVRIDPELRKTVKASLLKQKDFIKTLS